MDREFQIVTRRKLVPAWVLSVSVHVFLLICLSFLATHDSTSLDEAARPVGVVLVRSSAESEREYFDETAEEVARDSRLDSSEEFLPGRSGSQPESSIVPRFALPQASEFPLSGLTSVDTPSLSVSDSRPKLPGVDESAIIAAEQAKLLAASTRGPTAAVRVFGSKAAVGGSFVFLIDRSQSMGGGGLGVLHDAERELVRVLEGLQPEHRFQVAVYHDRSVFLQRRELLEASDANKALVPGFLSTKAAFGATAHEPALISALSLEPDVIFLLTDGGEPVLHDRQIRSIARLAKPRTSIHCIQFGSGPLRDSNNFLARLAAATGGEYGYVDVNNRRR